MAVDAQPDRMPSSTLHSRSSKVRLYFRRTATSRFANQQRIRSGSHSAASLPLFGERLTAGLASVRFRTSEAERRPVSASAAQRPLLCASERAMMCSMSVSDVLKHQLRSLQNEVVAIRLGRTAGKFTPEGVRDACCSAQPLEVNAQVADHVCAANYALPLPIWSTMAAPGHTLSEREIPRIVLAWHTRASWEASQPATLLRGPAIWRI